MTVGHRVELSLRGNDYRMHVYCLDAATTGSIPATPSSARASSTWDATSGR